MKKKKRSKVTFKSSSALFLSLLAINGVITPSATLLAEEETEQIEQEQQNTVQPTEESPAAQPEENSEDKLAFNASIYVEHQSEQADPTNPQYTILINKTDLPAEVTPETLSFEGAFQNAKLVSIADQQDNYKITLTKDIETQKTDGFEGVINLSGNKVAIHDDYIYIPNQPSKSTRDVLTPDNMATAGKAASAIFTDAATRALLGNSPKLLTVCSALGIVGGAVGIIFTVISFINQPEDPVLKALQEIDKKLTNLSDEVKNESDEIRNHITKDGYASYLNAITKNYSDHIKGIIQSYFEPIYRNMTRISHKAGTTITDLDSDQKTPLEKIGNYFANSAEGYAEYEILDSAFRGLYYYDKNGDANKGYHNEENFNKIISYLNYLDGTAQPVTSGNQFGTANICKVFNGFTSINYDWNNQTFNDRKTFNDLTKKQVIDLSSNLYLSLNWSKSSNEQKKKVAEEQKEALLRVDPNAGKTNSENYSTYQELSSKIATAGDAISHIDAQLKVLDGKLDNLMKSTFTPADEKLKKEQDQFDNSTVVYNYRIEKTFQRKTTYVNSNTLWGYVDGSAEVRDLSYKPAATWSEAEFTILKRAAQIRKTTINQEVASFDATQKNQDYIVTNANPKHTEDNQRTFSFGKIYHTYTFDAFRDYTSSGIPTTIDNISTLTGWVDYKFGIADSKHKDATPSDFYNLRYFPTSSTASSAPVF